MDVTKQLFDIGAIVGKGRYEIRNVIGWGQLGEVYSAIDLHAKSPTTVAIKRLDLEGGNQGRAQLHRECLALSQINHPAIVKIFDVIDDDKQILIVEEFLAGGNLSTEITRVHRQKKAQQAGAISALEVARIGLSLARGLNEIHARGFFHGDIKPTNVGFRDKTQEDSVLLDFGQSGFSDALILKDMSSQRISLPYLPPEVSGLLGEMEHVSRDLYSLGVTLYECAVGEVPFCDEDPKLVIRRVLTEVPPPISSLVPDFPEALSNVISKLMRKQPSDRYRTAIGLAADLDFCFEELQKEQIPRVFALGRKDKIRELNYRIPMIGRQKEVDILRRKLQESKEGTGGIVFIAAPSGVGKSRLSMELAAEAHRQGVEVYFTKFSEFERNLPFSAIHVMMHELSVHLSKIPSIQIDIWKMKILDKLGSNGNLLLERFSELKPFLPNFPPLLPMEYEESSRAFLHSLGVFLSVLNLNEKGQIIVFDDLQWADASSIELLREILIISNEIGLAETLIIGTYRNNEVQQDHPLMARVLSETRKDQRIELVPLSHQESKTLVELIIDECGPEIDKLFDFTFRMTLGNPFFSYECLKSLISSEVYYFQEHSGTWLFDENKQMNTGVSSNMAKLVAERINRIPRLEREALIIASIIGSKFPLAVLTQLVDSHIMSRISDDTKDELLQYRDTSPDVLTQFIQKQLVAHQLILPDETHFVFFHDKVREAAIDIAAHELKVSVHQACGEYLAAQCLAHADPTQVCSQQIYDAAFHLMRGSLSSRKPLTRQILFMAAQRAVQVFAYQKALDYLEIATTLFDFVPKADSPPEDKEEWIAVNELMADALGLSRRVEEAISLFDLLYQIIDNPLHKAEVCAKRVDYNIALFRYEKSITAGREGLKQVGVTPCNSELSAAFTIVFGLPWLIILYVYCRLFSTRDREIITRKDTVRIKLMIAYQVPTYFSRPLITVAQQYLLTRELILCKDSHFRSMMIAYWGVITASVGLPTISERCFYLAMKYFDKNPNPVAQGFIGFVWGYNLYFPGGRASEAREKIKNAYTLLSGVGESFWQYLCIQALIQLDYFCLGNGEARPSISKLANLWEEVHFEPCAMGSFLRFFLYEERTEELHKWLKITRDGGDSIEAQGFESLDLVYTYLLPGEIYLLQHNLEKATPLLERAFKIAIAHSHRVAVATLSASLLAQAYIRSNRPFKALIPLAASYLNITLSVSVFKPYTYYTTGELLKLLGLSSLGHFVMQRGVHYARIRGWLPIAAEGWLLLGQSMVKSNPDRAEDYLNKALDYFNSRGNKFLSKCARSLLHDTTEELLALQCIDTSERRTTRTTNFSLRQEIETSALIEIFLELSSLTNIENILDAVLRALCRCTGAEIGVIFIHQGDQWIPARSVGVDHDTLIRGNYGLAGVDKGFFDHCVLLDITTAKVRSCAAYSRDLSGSTLVLPLAYKGKQAGICYLSNGQINNLFDEKALETISPIAAQAAIALQNVELLDETEKKANLIAAHTENLQKMVVAGQDIAAQVDLSSLSKTLIRRLQEFLDSKIDVDIFVHVACLPEGEDVNLSEDLYYRLQADGLCNSDACCNQRDLEKYRDRFAVRDPRSEYTLAFVCIGNSSLQEIEGIKSILEAICTNVSSALTTVRLEHVLRLFEERNREIELSRDQLQEAIDSLAESTERLRCVFRHSHLGILLCDSNGIILPEYSLAVKEMLGIEDLSGRHIVDTVFAHSPNSDLIRSTLKAMMGEEEIIYRVNKANLPSSLVISDRLNENVSKMLELEWAPVFRDNSVHRMMLTIRDVSLIRKLEEQAQSERRRLDLILEIIAAGLTQYDEFSVSIVDFVERWKQDLSAANVMFSLEIIRSLMMELHTFKGEARILGLTHMAGDIHRAESAISEASNVGDILEILITLYDLVREYSFLRQQHLASSQNSFDIEMNHLDKAITAVSDMKQIQHDRMLDITFHHLMQARYPTLSGIVKQCEKNVSINAQEHPKTSLVCISAEEWVMTAAMAKRLSDALQHLVRNSIAHGGVDELCITLKCERKGNICSIVYRDNGLGMHMEKLRGLLPVAEDTEICERLLCGGVTTKSTATDISGRGVGLAAVRSLLVRAGFCVHIELDGDSSDAYRQYRVVISTEERSLLAVYHVPMMEIAAAAA